MTTTYILFKTIWIWYWLHYGFWLGKTIDKGYRGKDLMIECKTKLLNPLLAFSTIIPFFGLWCC